MQTRLITRHALYALALWASFLAPSTGASAQTRLSVSVTGDCAPLFVGGRQRYLTNANRHCLASVISPRDYEPSQEIWFIVSRRATRSWHSATGQIQRTYRKNFFVDNFKKDAPVSIAFLLKGSNRKARYTVRAFSNPQLIIDDPAPTTCDQIFDEFVNESLKIRSCMSAADCGKSLIGTSCGCTRDHVARKDADTTTFYTIIARAEALGCTDSLPISSTCDCPEVSGVACVAGICDWRAEAVS